MNDTYYAKEKLLSEGYTCVLCSGSTVHTSTLRGVKPLVQWLESGTDMKGFCAADKVVGKATAFLYVLLGVQAVYAHVISKSALTVLKESSIEVQYGTLVENIINRKGDGICPFEETVLEIHNAAEAYPAILRKMKEMNILVSEPAS